GCVVVVSDGVEADFGTDLRGEHYDTIMDDNNPMLADAT
ncbi:hypothetical protein Tco_1268754, partial [Tanacetum coccineum]